MTTAGMTGRELVERVYEEFRRGRIPDELFAEDVTWDVGTMDSDGPFRGPAGIAEFFRRWLGTWEDYSFGVDRITEAPDGRIVVLFWESGKGKGSGVEVRLEALALWTVENGRVSRYKAYLDREDGLREAGLQPE